MLRTFYQLLFLTLSIALVSCSEERDSGGATTAPPAEELPDYFVEDFNVLSAGRWELALDEDVNAPVAANGLLRFQWQDAGAGSQARLVLRRSGFYEAVALNLPILDLNVQARVTLDLSANGLARRALIGIRGGNERTVEAVVEDESGSNLERETTRLSDLQVPPGTSDERVRIELDVAGQAIRFYFADELILTYAEPGLSLPASSRVAIEVEGRDTENTAIDSFEAGILSEVPERRISDVRPNHTPPSRVQWLFKLREAGGKALPLSPEQAESLVPRVFEDSLPIDLSETCPVVRTFESLPLNVAIVLDHTLSMETFGGIEAMKESAKALLDALADSHTFSIWEFHDNQEGGYSQLLPPGGTRAEGKQVIDDFEPTLRGFSLCWDTLEKALVADFPEQDLTEELRVLMFFSDGVDTSSLASPGDLVDEAQDRGVQLYSLGYGQLTSNSRMNLMLLSQETNGLFAEALTPSEILPEFEGLTGELSGFLQLAYITGRLLDSNIESFVSLDYEGQRVQQSIQGTFDGKALAFDEDDEPFDPQLGVLTVNGPLIQQDGGAPALEVLVSSAHIPRETDEFQLTLRLFEVGDEGEVEVPLDGLIQAVVTSVPSGPFDKWTIDSTGQAFNLSGPEVCFGDFGPLFRVRIQGETLPATFRLELKADNAIYGGLLRFAGSLQGTGLDEYGNWVVSVSGSL